jgi:hypothetical protein
MGTDYFLVPRLIYFYSLPYLEYISKTPIAPPTPIYNDLTPQVFQPPAEFHPPQVSNLIIYLVSLTIILLFIFMAWIIYRRWHSRPPQKIFNSLEGLGEAARLALDDLAAGLDGQDAIIICYTRMSEVVMQKRDMERGKSRTASEFATRLISAGLPGDSVRRLTRLFESARYGMRESQPVEIEEAKACLTEIARYCGVEV